MSAAETVVSTLKAKLILDASGFTSTAESVSKQFGLSWGDAANGMKIVGTVATAVATDVSKAAITYEKAFANVRKTVDAPIGTDAEEFFENLNNNILEATKTLPVSATELANVYAAAGQLGISAENLEEFGSAMIMLSSATNLGSEEAATKLARFANVMGTDQTQFDNMGSSIVMLGNNTATTESEIVEFAGRLAATSKTYGITEADTLGLAAAMSSLGMQPEAAGTAFYSFANDVQGAISEGGEKLETFASVSGMTSAEFSQAWKEDATGAFQSFLEGLGQVEDTTQLFSDLEISQTREQTMLLTLASNTDLLSESLQMSNEAWDANTAMTTEAETAFGTTASQLQLLQNNIDLLDISLGETLLPIIQDLVKELKPFLDSVGNFIKENPDLAKNAMLLGVALGFVGNAISVLIPLATFLSAANPFTAWAIAIVAVVGLLAWLSTSLGEIEAQASATAEQIANIDTSTQTVVENRLGQFEVVEYEYTIVTLPVEGTWDQYYEAEARYDEGLRRYVTREEDLANAASGTVSAIEDQTTALEGQQTALETTADTIADNAIGEQLTETMEQPQTTFEQAQALLDQMNTSLGGLNDTTDQFGTSWDESMTGLNELIESETFQQFANQPIDPAVAESWNAFSEAVDKTVTGFGMIQDSTGFTELPAVSDDVIASYQALADAIAAIVKVMMGGTGEEEGAMAETTAAAGEEEAAGMSLMTALQTLPEMFLGILTSATQLSDYFNGPFQEAVGEAIKVLCKTGVNDKGETTTGGGNTLYTAAGAVKGVFEDIVTATQEMIRLWNGPFTPAVNKLKEACGVAEGAASAAASAAESAAVSFNSWADAIERVIAALKVLSEITGGGEGGSGLGLGLGFGGFRALGGEVGQAKTYVVGEEGPELFVPKEDGYIISNEELEDNADMFIPHPKPAGEVGNEILEDLNAGSVVIINFNGDVIGDEESISGYVENATRTAMMEEIYAAL